MSTKEKGEFCEVCGWYSENGPGHYWYCKKRPLEDIVSDMALKIDKIESHFN